MATRFNVFHIINSFLVICFSIRLVLGLCYFRGAAAPFFCAYHFCDDRKMMVNLCAIYVR